MKATELINAGLQEGGHVYKAQLYGIQDVQVMYITKDHTIFARSGENAERIIDFDEGWELTKHAAAQYQVDQLKKWLARAEQMLASV